jgi:hypothetical protein
MNQKLIDAASDGNLAEVKSLVGAGANIHVGDDDALQWAARNGHQNETKGMVTAIPNVQSC